MPNIKVKGEEYYVSEEEFKEIKENASPNLEVKELAGWEQVAVYVGDFLLGYVASKILDKIIYRERE